MTPETDLLAVAMKYRSEGWWPIPIPFREKGPELKAWQQLRLKTKEELARHFNNGPLNIGILTGADSNNLVDVDLDQPECLSFARLLLPATRIFGRHGNPLSHWLFQAATDATRIPFKV